MTEAIDVRVARGVALLDKTLADWDERIDLDRLDLGSTCNCILGQEFARHPEAVSGDDSYDLGLTSLFDPDDDLDRESRRHGFDSSWHADVKAEAAEYAALTAEWKRVILARRGEAS